ncbi:MAG: hypothetical protein JWM40_2130 [Frankiales bacterium]|nr:hypothetical protein [Frankiales bacterium]
MLRRLLPVLVSLAALTACGTTVPLTSQSQGALASSDGLSAATTTPGGDVSGSSTGQALTPTGTATGSLPTRAASGSTAAAAPSLGPSASATSSSYSSIPITGRGWDARTISIGYVTQNDFTRTAAAAGYNTVNAGDQVGDVQAVLAALNAAGGLFGRRLVGIDRDNSSADVTGNPEGTSAANCDFFKNDKKVVAVLNLQSALDTDVFRQCTAKAKLPVMSLSIQPVTDAVVTPLGGYLIPLLTPTYDTMMPTFMRRLTAQGYFKGWSTAIGQAAATPLKTGVIVTSDNQGAQVLKVYEKALAAIGQKPVVFRYAPSGTQQQTDFQSAVLQFRSAGVTHVLSDGANISLFMLQASTQTYRPRYAISSYSAPQPFVETLAPKDQLRGAVGIGSSPTLDVDLSEDPGPTPGSPWCLKALKAGGQTFNSGKRFAQAVAFALCDGLRMLAFAGKAGGGLTGPQLVAGVGLAGPTFPTSFAFSSGFRPGVSTLPGSARDLAYNEGCSCFRYGRTKTTF